MLELIMYELSANTSAFAVGDMLVFYLGEEDVQTITIYHSEDE